MLCMKYFAQLLNDYRERSGLSKTDLAHRIGVSPNYVINLINKHQKPPKHDLVYKIAYMLNLSDDERNDLLSAALYERLSDDDKKYLDDLNIDLNKRY